MLKDASWADVKVREILPKWMISPRSEFVCENGQYWQRIFLWILLSWKIEVNVSFTVRDTGIQGWAGASPVLRSTISQSIATELATENNPGIPLARNALHNRPVQWSKIQVAGPGSWSAVMADSDSLADAGLQGSLARPGQVTPPHRTVSAHRPPHSYIRVQTSAESPSSN